MEPEDLFDIGALGQDAAPMVSPYPTGTGGFMSMLGMGGSQGGQGSTVQQGGLARQQPTNQPVAQAAPVGYPQPAAPMGAPKAGESC
jgi:hypothetical protein